MGSAEGTQIRATCTVCHAQTTAASGAKHVTCPGCGATGRWFRCTNCNEVAGVWAQKDANAWTFTCPQCSWTQVHEVGHTFKPWPRWGRVLLSASPVLFLIAIGAGVLLLANAGHRPDLDCNGTTMGPGDVCRSTQYVNGNKTNTTTETYAERVAAARGGRVSATTVVIVIGGAALVGTFGGVKAWRWSGQAQIRIRE